MAELKPSHEKALALAALCGFKIALGPAFLRASQRAPSTQSWATAALGEMTLDKLGVFPARFRPMLLIPHTLAGVWTAHESLKEDGDEADTTVLAAAAVVAAGVTVTLPMIRIALQQGAANPRLPARAGRRLRRPPARLTGRRDVDGAGRTGGSRVG